MTYKYTRYNRKFLYIIAYKYVYTSNYISYVKYKDIIYINIIRNLATFATRFSSL